MELRSAGYPTPPGLHAQRGCSARVLSAGTISRITDAVADAVLEWQRRPLEEFYPVVYLDAIRVKVRVDHRVASRSAHIAVGAGHGRYQARGLSIWAPGPGREPP